MTEPAPQDAPPPTEPAAPSADDALRRLTAERLVEHLDQGTALVRRCTELAMAGRGDRLAPLAAAARLMCADAQIATALARVAQVESRHRSVVETVPKPDPHFLAWQQKQRAQKPNEMRRNVYEKMLAVLGAERAKDAACDAEDLRAATRHFDGPLHLPF